MQQEFADFKNRSPNEMEALRQENSQSKIEMDVTQKGKEKEVQVESKTPLCQPNEEESEYNPTLYTITITHHTPSLANHHTTTFTTAIKHLIPAHPHKRQHPFIDDITETPSM